MKRRWDCSHCGRTLRARLEARIVFHQCRPPRVPYTRARRISDQGIDWPTLEERWHSIFTDSAGGYEPPTPDQARTETDKSTGAFGRGYTPKEPE